MPIHNQFLLLNNSIQPHVLQGRGPVVAVEIQLPTALANHLQAKGTALPQPITGFALIDTGASKTCVEAQAISGLGVTPINRIKVQTPSGSTQQYLYPARVAFPGTTLPSIEFSSVVGSTLAAQGIVALIGRDVLARFLLVYNGPAGLYSLAL